MVKLRCFVLFVKSQARFLFTKIHPLNIYGVLITLYHSSERPLLHPVFNPRAVDWL